MSKVVDLSMDQMILSYAFILLLIVLVKMRGISREREILLSSFRMTVQLIMTGYILTYLFNTKNPLYSVLVVSIMEIFAIYNVYKRVRMIMPSKIKIIIAFSMIIGTLTSLMYFLLAVIRLSPWYEPRYFVPIAGMFIGNSMTAISLAVNRLVDGINTQRNVIETALMLGATPKVATKNIVDKTFDSAIMPTINSMVGMGIVFLPGMMTGQILSGATPFTAIRYQIAIMLGVLGSVALTVILFVQFGYRAFFNDENQLIY